MERVAVHLILSDLFHRRKTHMDDRSDLAWKESVPLYLSKLW